MINRITLFTCLSVICLIHCDSFLKGEVEDDSVSTEYADPSLVLNNLQLETRSIFSAASSIGGELTRMEYMFGTTYQDAFSPSSFNSIYGNAYNDLFTDANTLIKIAEDRNLYVHSGIAKILKANTMITLVDHFGDMPNSDDLDGEELQPTLTDDEVIYSKALDLLNGALSDLENPLNRDKPDTDLYYADFNDEERIESWKRVANTIKFKAHLNTGNTQEVMALINDGNLITDPSHDFQFSYSSNAYDPDSRHPVFTRNYRDNTDATDYLSVSFMNMLLTDKSFSDPRINYYIFRQSVPDDSENTGCIAAQAPPHFDEDDPYCLLPGGYLGRDHLMDDGIPQESPYPTYGVYPVGGAFDNNLGGEANSNAGLKGAGIQPILLSGFTHFMIAEAELMHNNNEAKSRLALGTAIEHSFNKVADFGDELAAGTRFEITDSTINAYKSVVMERFDNAPNQLEKLRVIAREYYFALWGNGYEAYNLMRRTGFPDRDDNLQPARSPNPGNWPRSLLYPHNMVHRNESIEQKTSADFLIGPFWDPDKGSTKFNF